jgi:hypothetical protein
MGIRFVYRLPGFQLLGRDGGMAEQESSRGGVSTGTDRLVHLLDPR